MWKKSALASALALSALGAHPDARALALGAAQVKSALGEPLRAEVEVPEITSEEASTFQVALGTPQEFLAAGVDYNPALRGTRVTLSRRPNGQNYLIVQGQQPVNEPFLTLVIDASWANGHVVRDYTLLIDPQRQQAVASAPEPGAHESAPVVTSAPPRTAPPPNVAPPRAAPEPAATPPVASSASGEGERVHVQRGDTAAAIVAAHPVEGVSLDQMLVAMLRANPRAFIRGNVNLIRAGAVINMPSAEQAGAISPASARRTVIAHSRDFRAYRQGLAMTAARGGSMTAGRRSATGSVQPQVQEPSAAPAPQDRLTLSHGKPASQTASAAPGRAEARIAQSRQAQEQAARETELNRNIKELSQLASASGHAEAASTAKPAAPAINIPASTTLASAMPARPAASAPPAAQPQGEASTATTAVASAPVAAASAAASRASSAQRPPTAAPMSAPSEPSWLDALMENWAMLAGGIVILLLLAGYGVYRGRQKGRSSDEANPARSAFSSSKLPPDSYFGASGGQQVDTRSGSGADAGSSMAYSPSQLEAGGDVDPVSEADVYLAYGRDAQAEEILKEALRTYPGRSSIYAKLAEIYAKHRNTQQLGALAAEAHRVTHGEGRDWQTIAHLGQELDPANPLYAPSNTPAAQPAHGLGLQNASPLPDPQSSLDLAGGAPRAASVPPALHGQFNPFAPTNFTPVTGSAPLTDNLDFTPPAQPGSNVMEFDPNAFAGSPGPVSPPTRGGPAKPADEDPLATKLALAREFHTIGDSSSARALVKEVLTEASGELKTKAEQFLRDLG